MEVKDVLCVIEETTRVEICDVTEILWEGIVNEIDFAGDIPYENYEVCNMVIKNDTLQIYI